MSTNNTFDAAGFQAYMQSLRDTEEKKFYKARDLLCSVLRTHGITEMAIEFDGEGDSGQITGCSFTPKQDKSFEWTEVPGTEADRWDYDKNGKWSQVRRNMNVAEAADDMAYSLLSMRHPGWEINEGSFGTIKLTVATRKIKFSINSRYTEIERIDGEA